MSYQRERDQFMVRCQLSPETARALLRHATTLQRLAEAQCNGDWPADNGDGQAIPCPLCDRHWQPSSIQGGNAARMAYRQNWRDIPSAKLIGPLRACPDCRTEARVHALLEGTQWQAWTQGDPRGYVLKLFPRTVRGCSSCDAISNRPESTLYHATGCGAVEKPHVVTRDDMYCGRVDSLGVPTR